MALPEYSLGDNFVLTPAEFTPEVAEMWARHVEATERTLIRDVLREQLRVETPFPTSASDEAAIFAAIFEDV